MGFIPGGTIRSITIHICRYIKKRSFSGKFQILKVSKATLCTIFLKDCKGLVATVYVSTDVL